ncbi:hypothetical protein WICPIJ_004874 [Wickerhamomyces pijperi]|uniref:M-phase phosphoprotein 6 n=1 Tax=Wickerhamomyces pijperi TaxID=599730 RepID=A0A9P8Q764_WICPI|nr:hypothetical protein WICPIJ_004874 [Wickerhamomyces pijperi]
MSTEEKTPAKLSSKLLGMKFMRQAEIRDEKIEEEKKESRLKDLSEWKSPMASSLKKSFASKPKIQTMGFSSINSMNQMSDVVGRRVFGAKEEPKKEKKQKDIDEDIDTINDPNDDESDDDDVAIESLWKQTQDSNQQKKGNFNKRSFKNRNHDSNHDKNKRNLNGEGDHFSKKRQRK